MAVPWSVWVFVGEGYSAVLCPHLPNLPTCVHAVAPTPRLLAGVRDDLGKHDSKDVEDLAQRKA